MVQRMHALLPTVAVAAVVLVLVTRHAGSQAGLACTRHYLKQATEDGLPPVAQQQLQEQLHQNAAPSLQLPLTPQPAWMAECCMHKKLRDLYLPGTHDSGTAYPWTVPHHLPFVFDEVAAVIFNIVGDLSRTQHHTVYEQLQAGVRVLDLRLAINPWIPLQQRLEVSGSGRSDSSRSGSRRSLYTAHQQQRGMTLLNGKDSNLGLHFTLDHTTLQSSINYTAAGGPLTADELAGAIVISHSLPGVRLAELLADVKRFLTENPTEVLTILVKGDTVDVNVASTQRMTLAAWAVTADIFRQQLPGVQLLTKQQVEQQTLAEITAEGPGGSVLLYSRELQEQGLTALTKVQLEILESWFNGTNTEDVPTLKDRLVDWMMFWHNAGWKRNSKPYMLLASAEVTLGVKTILQLLKNRIWMLQQQQQQWVLQQQEQIVASNPGMAELLATEQHGSQDSHSGGLLGPLCKLWQRLLHGSTRNQQQESITRKPTQRFPATPSQQQSAPVGPGLLDLYREMAPKLGAMRTLYDMGVAANQQLLHEVLLNDQVFKTFNIWSLDALSSDIVTYIIQLNSQPISS